MKVSSIFFLVLLLTFFAYSQEEYEEVRKNQFSILGAVSFPTGDFGETNTQKAGFASTGFGVGAEFDIPIDESYSVLTSGIFVANPVDVEGMKTLFQNQFGSSVNIKAESYSSILLMSGIQFIGQSSSKSHIFINAQGGFLFGTLPEITLSSGNAQSNQPSASTTAFAFAVEGGMILGDRFKIGAKYISAKPKYNVTASGTGGSISGTIEQPTSMVLLHINIGLSK
ncbi:MAG: hypothetical protein AB1728_12810 [Bacteroidota bacterium]